MGATGRTEVSGTQSPESQNEYSPCSYKFSAILKYGDSKSFKRCGKLSRI
jgi:hypothetical protein